MLSFVNWLGAKMVDLPDRRAQARYDIALAAAQRWASRRQTREDNITDVKLGGAGAADSADRQVQYKTREDRLDKARVLSANGLLSRALERRIGPSLDFDRYPPSEQARLAGRPVARITQGDGKELAPVAIATGFLIARGLLLTNHHVLPSAGEASGLFANFLYDYNDRGVATGRYYPLAPDAFFHADELLDFALVAVEEGESATLDDLGVVPLIEATPKILVGQPVNIIQHPDGQGKTYAIRENRLVDVLDSGFLHYETDTLGGSSGSPAFSQNWELVALHHSGVPRVENDRILDRAGKEWDPEKQNDDDIDWIANEGVRVSTMVAALKAVRMDTPARQARLDELLRTTGDPLQTVEKIANQAGLAPSNPILSQPGAADVAQNIFNFSGPVTINIQGPTVMTSAAADVVVTAKPVGALEKRQLFDPNYAKRDGYQDDFLGVTIPIPGVGEARLEEMYRDSKGGIVVLPYHHYSLAMNEKRRLCMWTASNADYSDNVRDERPRADFGGEDWRLDPRVPESLQIQDADFYKPAGRIDRGHIVRRDDNCWGVDNSGFDEIAYANADTYHWTNCTPQHEAFNQEQAKKPEYKGVPGIWGGLEMLVAKSLAKNDRKASIFAGPVLDNRNDPSADFGKGPIQYPSRFWKIIMINDKIAGLMAYGFILDQGPVLTRYGIERIDVSRFAAQQVPVTAIEAATGLIFDPAIHVADVMKDQTGQVLASLDEVQHTLAAPLPEVQPAQV